MRRYDDPVEVRRGQVSGTDGGGADPSGMAPEQFLWRGRLWKVRTVVAHWVETGPWWQSAGVHALRGETSVGTGTGTATTTAPATATASIDLIAEREVWRVEASRGRGNGVGPGLGLGVFDLSFDWSGGTWRLTRCVD
jgi:hypothetical protein